MGLFLPVMFSPCNVTELRCRLLANSEQEEETEDEIDEIFAKYKESLKGGIAITFVIGLSTSR